MDQKDEEDERLGLVADLLIGLLGEDALSSLVDGDSSATPTGKRSGPVNALTKAARIRKESYFQTCDRDKEGRCLPSGQTGSGSGQADDGSKGKPEAERPTQAAEVDYPESAQAVAKHLFGRDVPSHELAAMAGALPGAKVTVKAEGEHLDVEVEHAEYGAFRQLFRDGPDVVCVNHTIRVHKTGGGLGTRIFSQQVEELAKAGVKEIRASCKRDDAKGWNGYVTWPKLGYDGKIPDEAKGSAFSQLLGRGMPRPLRQAKTVRELLSLPGGQDWWTKHGTTAKLTFDLREGSESRKVLEEYKAERAARSGKKGLGRSIMKSSASDRDGKDNKQDGAEEIPLDRDEQEALDAVWARRAGGKATESNKPVNRLPTQKSLVRKATSADVLQAVRELGGESRWVPLSRLGPKLGMAPAELHAAVTQLRRSGELTAQAVEGRGGLSADEQRWAQLDPFGSGRVGAVMLRPKENKQGVMKAKPKRPQEPAWQRNARIDAWKKQQYGWVIYTPGPAEPKGYVQQVNEAFYIISATTNDKNAARKFTFDHAFEVLQGLKSRHNRQGYIEYVGPKHPEE